MVFVEIGAMVVFASLVSAWTVWMYNNKNGTFSFGRKKINVVDDASWDGSFFFE